MLTTAPTSLEYCRQEVNFLAKVAKKSVLTALNWSRMDSSLHGVDYEVISGDPFWPVAHLNRTTPSALFYSQ